LLFAKISSFFSSRTQTWYYIYSRPLHSLINYSITTYYEDRQIYDKRSTGAFLKVYFQAQREFIWKCFCICLLASCSLWCIIVHFLYYSSCYLLIESNINSSSECVTQIQHVLLCDELSEWGCCCDTLLLVLYFLSK